MRDQDLAISVADDADHFSPDGGDIGHEAEDRALGSIARPRSATRCSATTIRTISTDPKSRIGDRNAKSDIAAITCSKNDDGTLSDVWLISGHPVDVYTVDLTDPDATAWFTGMFQRALDLGYSGWMYDFGEYVQPQTVAKSGMIGRAAPQPLSRALRQGGARRARQLHGDWYYFSRSGYTGSSQYTPMVWSGDPDASFGDAEGLPAQMRAGITASMSGVAHWGSDISGFKCQADGNAAADGELVTRWIEAGAMSSNMHDEDSCSGGGGPKANIWTSPDAQAAWRTYARLHTRMLPYFVALAAEAHATGAPVIRSPWLMHPERRELAPVGDAFYVGPSLYAAPVVARGARDKTLTLPPGLFVDWHDQTLVDGGTGGVSVTLPAALDKLPLLLVDGTLLPLLDPTIDTTVPELNPTVVGPDDVADVYDVVGVVSTATGAARFSSPTAARSPPPTPAISRRARAAR